ncbi:MAG: 30S ribosomal protein S20 [Gammaproteobacteria bacterium]|nr:30S ribosomal protein S20 [Gammaproteobacteria bacterium]
MANTAQARKRARQADAHRDHNNTLRTRFKSAVKDARVALTKGDKTTAQTTYQKTVSMIDKTVAKGLIHKNKAARQKSRLNTRLRALA